MRRDAWQLYAEDGDLKTHVMSIHGLGVVMRTENIVSLVQTSVFIPGAETFVTTGGDTVIMSPALNVYGNLY
jgi:hypothetical protein